MNNKISGNRLKPIITIISMSKTTKRNVCLECLNKCIHIFKFILNHKSYSKLTEIKKAENM